MPTLHTSFKDEIELRRLADGKDWLLTLVNDLKDDPELFSGYTTFEELNEHLEHDSPGASHLSRMLKSENDKIAQLLTLYGWQVKRARFNVRGRKRTQFKIVRGLLAK